MHWLAKHLGEFEKILNLMRWNLVPTIIWPIENFLEVTQKNSTSRDHLWPGRKLFGPHLKELELSMSILGRSKTFGYPKIYFNSIKPIDFKKFINIRDSRTTLHIEKWTKSILSITFVILTIIIISYLTAQKANYYSNFEP